MNKKLCIVMTTDQNYILQTRVAIWTMLNAACEDTYFEIHILCSPRLLQENRNKILDLQKQWNTVKISFDEIDEKIFQDAKSVAYIPVSSFYRLMISNIIDDERCLFLDGDTVVNTDLTAIYNVDLTEKYLMGVKDCGIQRNMKEYDAYKDILGIPTMNEYVNAGVLLMNLSLLREDNMDKAFISCMADYYKMMDQDILNKCCFGKIGHLDLKYNLFVDYYNRLDILKKTSFSVREIEEAASCDGIIHFTGKYKAWHFLRIRGSHLWWECAKKALPPEDYENIYKNALKKMEETDWTYILGRCENMDHVIVAGFSDIGRDVADSLARCNIRNVVCFSDNDRTKQGADYHGLKVHCVEEAHQKYQEALWINTSQASAKAISTQLLSIGVKKENILVYINKSEQYYDNLDEQYQEYEEKLLALKQSGIEH